MSAAPDTEDRATTGLSGTERDPHDRRPTASVHPAVRRDYSRTMGGAAMSAGTALMFWVMLPLAIYACVWAYDRGRQ